MGEYSIDIEATDGYRYFCVKPPLNEDQKAEVFKELGEDIESAAIGNGNPLRTTVNTQPGEADDPCSVLGLETIQMEMYGTNIGDVARKIGSVLEAAGHSVATDLEPQFAPMEWVVIGSPESE